MSTIDLFNQHNRTLATITSVLLVILMSLIIAKTVLFFVEGSVDNRITPGQSITQPSQTAARPENYGLGRLNLFGSVEQKAAPVVVDAPKTSLNLRSSHTPVDGNFHEIVLTISVEAKTDDKTLFLIELHQKSIQ